MKVTAITNQVKSQGRYSIFIDGEYGFSLSEGALLESHIVKGMELTSEQLEEFKSLSADDKLYLRTLRLVSMRAKTRGEVELYLHSKGASPSLTETILNKLSNIGLIDDKKYARDYIRNRANLRPTSRLKVRSDLLKRRISEKVIAEALEEEESGDTQALVEIIRKKRMQSKYKDKLKLMQYLARQGFNYHDIKQALSDEQDY